MGLPSKAVKNSAESMSADRLRAVIYGRPGAGKTTRAAGWYPKTNLIIDLEGGTRMLPGEHFVMRPKTYSEFMAIVNDLVTAPHEFTTVTIDTVDNLVRMADSEAGQRGGKVAAGLVEYGKGLADRDATVLRDIRRLLSTDLGVLLVAHPTTVSEEKDGESTERVYPRIDPNDRIRQEILGLVDFVLHIRKDDHMIQSGGDSSVETKRRVDMPDEILADARQLAVAVSKGIADLGATPKKAAVKAAA